MTISTTTPLGSQERQAIRDSTTLPTIATSSWTPLGNPGASTLATPR